MDRDQSPGYVLVIMKNLNLAAVVYIAALMACSLSGIIRENSALKFLSEIPAVPPEPWKLPLVAVCLCLSCLFFMEIRCEGGWGLFIRVCLEIAVGFWLSWLLGFGYTGIVLLILADTMRYFPRSRWKFPAAVGICLIYLLLDYDLLSAFFNVVPLEAYLEYYQSGPRGVFLGVKNVISSLNMFVFLVYMVLLVREQLSEKERILSLNEELNDANARLQEANRQMEEANRQLEEYAREAEKMVETRERNRLAREIHDTLGHALTGIITGIEACTVLMDVAPEAAREQLKAIGDVARQGMTDVRRSVKALRPDMLEKFDLAQAIENTVEEMSKASSVEITYRCTTDLNCFSDDEEEIIYRIVQESVTNSIRHGKASRIQVEIDRKYNMLRVSIRDNGTGCKEVKKGFGLSHMEERLNMLHGTLTYCGDSGFEVEAKIPIRWGTEEKKHD